jgi:Putative prokaryotic signal transducing protein
MVETNFIEVYRAANSIEAHLLKGELEAAGIRVMVSDEAASAMRPGLWWTSPRILVDETDAAQALALIQKQTE